MRRGLIEGGFEVALEDGEGSAPQLLLATGLVADLPTSPASGTVGRGTYNCCYCDGGRTGSADRRIRQATEVLALTWRCYLGADVVRAPMGGRSWREDRDKLDRHGIRVIETKIDPCGGRSLECILFETAAASNASALYIYGAREPTHLAEKLGCELTDKGVIETRSYERTNVPGLFAAGDASRRVQFAIVAAAEGAAAAFAINNELYKEDFR